MDLESREIWILFDRCGELETVGGSLEGVLGRTCRGPVHARKIRLVALLHGDAGDAFKGEVAVAAEPARAREEHDQDSCSEARIGCHLLLAAA